MKLDLPLPVWIITVLLALCAGVVLGSLVPVPRSGAVAPSPAPVADTSMPPAAPAEPALAEAAGGPQEDTAGLGEGEWPAESEPVPGWGTVAEGPGVIAPGTDTLPAAPLAAVALPDPPPSETARSPERPVVRISDSRGPAAPAPQRASADPCAVVIHDPSAPDPTGCRRAAQRRFQAMCPKEGDMNHRGPVICIRDPD